MTYSYPDTDSVVIARSYNFDVAIDSVDRHFFMIFVGKMRCGLKYLEIFVQGKIVP